MLITNFVWTLVLSCRSLLKTSSAVRKRRPGRYVGENEVLEDRTLLSANYCNSPPVHTTPTPPPPVTYNNHIVTINGTVGSDDVFVLQDHGVTQVFVGSAEYDFTGVCGIIFDGATKSSVSSTDNVFIDSSVRSTIELIGGLGINNFVNASSSSTWFVGTKGTDNFSGGTRLDVFSLGSGSSRVTTGTGLNEIDCSSSKNSSATIDLFGCNIIYLGNGDIQMFAEADSSGIVFGTRTEFKNLEFSEDPDAGCYIGIVTGR